MSGYDSRENMARGSEEHEHGHRMSHSNRTRSLPDQLNIAHYPPTMASGASRAMTTSGPNISVTAPSLSPPAPHRAWETGYQSPFATARAYAQPQPRATDARMRYSPDNTKDDIPAHSTSTSSLPMAMVDTTPGLRHPQSTPQRSTYRPRVPRIVTKEIALDDADLAVMIKLGLSPFMVNQDMIANQNRLVRNECTFARHVQRLQRDTADADARHSRTERDIYKHLEQLRPTPEPLNVPGTAHPILPSTNAVPRNTHADPDFLALEQAHRETCARLEALSQQVMEYSQATQRALTELTHRIDQMMEAGGYMTDRPIIAGSPHGTTSTAPVSPLLLSASSFSLKRKWGSSSADSILGSPNTMPPPTPDFS